MLQKYCNEQNEKEGMSSSWIELTSPLKFALGVYLLVSLVLLYLKPDLMFKPDGTLREIGTSSEATPFPFWLATFTAGIIAYFWAYQYHFRITGE